MPSGCKTWLGFVLLIAVCVAGRLIDERPNVAPVAAAALLAGYAFRSRLLALAVPLASMAICDWFFEGTYAWPVMVAVYVAFCTPVLMGRWLDGRWFLGRLAGCTLAMSVWFYLSTNFAVWASGWMYERSLAGLLECYAAAWPFFRNTLQGNVCWAGALFGAYGAYRVLAANLARDRSPAAPEPAGAAT